MVAVGNGNASGLIVRPPARLPGSGRVSELLNEARRVTASLQR